MNVLATSQKATKSRFSLTQLVATIVVAGMCMVTQAANSAQTSETLKRVVVFGDSNVDNGNLYRLTEQRLPAAPRWRGRESDGPVVVEYLAQLLHASLEDHAVSGATSGESNIISLLAPQLTKLAATGVTHQVEDFVKNGGHLGSGDVVVIWAGSNDIYGVKRDDASTLKDRIAGAQSNLEQVVMRLHASGGRRFVVANRTPREVLGSDNDLNGVDLNTAIADIVKKLVEQTGDDIRLYDAYAAISDMVKSPPQYGFTEPSARCIDVPVCARQNVDSGLDVADTFINWDQAHKTTHVHRIMAEQILKLLQK